MQDGLPNHLPFLFQTRLQKVRSSLIESILIPRSLNLAQALKYGAGGPTLGKWHALPQRKGLIYLSAKQETSWPQSSTTKGWPLETKSWSWPAVSSRYLGITAVGFSKSSASGFFGVKFRSGSKWSLWQTRKAHKNHQHLRPHSWVLGFQWPSHSTAWLDGLKMDM